MCRAVDVRVKVLNGSGVQGAAGNTSQALTRKGFVTGGADNDPRGTVDHSEIRYAASDLAKAQLVAAFVPGAQLVRRLLAVGHRCRAGPRQELPGARQHARRATTGAAGAADRRRTLSPEAACQ